MRKYIPYIIIAILLALLVFRKNETTVITIPEKKGSFEQNDPDPIAHYDTIYEAGETKIKEVPNPINQELLAEYNNLKDSISKQKFVKEAITERTYRETYQDSIQKITVETEVIGTMKSQKVDYTVFEQNIPVEVNNPKFNVFAGMDMEYSPDLKIIPELTITTKKTHYSLGYDLKTGSIRAGVKFKLF